MPLLIDIGYSMYSLLTSVHPEMAPFVLIGVLSPKHRLYEPETAGFRLRCTDVRLTENPCETLIRKK